MRRWKIRWIIAHVWGYAVAFYLFVLAINRFPFDALDALAPWIGLMAPLIVHLVIGTTQVVLLYRILGRSSAIIWLVATLTGGGLGAIAMSYPLMMAVFVIGFSESAWQSVLGVALAIAIVSLFSGLGVSSGQALLLKCYQQMPALAWIGRSIAGHLLGSALGSPVMILAMGLFLGLLENPLLSSAFYFASPIAGAAFGLGYGALTMRVLRSPLRPLA